MVAGNSNSRQILRKLSMTKKMGISSPLNINDSSRQQKSYQLMVVVFPTKEGSEGMRLFVDGCYLLNEGEIC